MSKKYKCDICNHIVKTCERLGDRSICEELADKMYADKLTPDEFIKEIEKKFGKERFHKELEKK